MDQTPHDLSQEELNDQFRFMVLILMARFNRLPTEEEVKGYLYGDESEKERIWIGEINGGKTDFDD